MNFCNFTLHPASHPDFFDVEMTNSSSILHLDQTSAIPIIFFLISIKKTNDNLSLSICKNIFVLSTLLSSPTSCLTRQLSTCGRSSKTLDMFLFDLMANDKIFFTTHIHIYFQKLGKKDDKYQT